MTATKPRLWTKDFILFTVGAFFIGLMFLLTMTTISEFVINKFQATSSDAGLSAGIFVIGLLLARLLIGKYLEIIGRKKLFYIGVFLTFVATLLYFPAENLSFLIAVRFFHGFVNGLVMTVMQTAVMDVIPEERRGEEISYFTLGFILASAIGPFLGVVILQYTDMTLIFVLCSIAAGLNIIIAFLVSISEIEMTNDQLQELKGFHFKDFFEVSALPISSIMGIFAFAYSSIISFLASFSKEVQLMTAASFFFIIYSIVVFLTRPITGKMLDSKGDNIVMYPAILSFSAGLIVLSQAEHGIILLLAGALIGLGYGNLLSASQAIAMKSTPRYRVGRAASTFFIFLEGGLGVGPFILGFFVSNFGYRNMYLMLGIMVFIGIFLYYFLYGSNKSYKKQLTQASKQQRI